MRNELELINEKCFTDKDVQILLDFKRVLHLSEPKCTNFTLFSKRKQLNHIFLSDTHLGIIFNWSYKH